MRQLNPAELFYLSVNTDKSVNELAHALLTTEDHVRLVLSQLPVAPLVVKRKPGRPKKLAPTPQTVMPPLVVETPKVEPPAMANMARVKGRGAIAMTGEASQIADKLAGINIG